MVIGMGGLVEPDSTGRAMDNEEGEKTVKKKRNACSWLLVVSCWLLVGVEEDLGGRDKTGVVVGRGVVSQLVVEEESLKWKGGGPEKKHQYQSIASLSPSLFPSLSLIGKKPNQTNPTSRQCPGLGE